MAKIPFDIKFRPQIESGEYKVETRDGRKARIIHWDLNCTSPIVAVMDAHIDLPGEIVDVFSVSGRAFDDLESPSDLFIVTPEEELTEFEDGLRQVYEEAVKEAMVFPDRTSEDFAKTHSVELLKLAKEELKKTFYLLKKDDYRTAFDLGKAEALRTRSTELTENLDKSGLDEDSIPYHLIEFMCNLYDCQNWKEIEGTAELYVTRIKAAALKDLPRLEKCVSSFVYGNVDNGVLFYKYRYIHLSDLEKLPGFKED